MLARDRYPTSPPMLEIYSVLYYNRNMKTELQILQEALKTQDPAKLYALVSEAIDLAKFHASQKAFADLRVKKLSDQVQRQTEMIENLEKTLWGKK